PQRRLSIGLLTLRHIGNRLHATVRVFDVNDDVSITPTRHTFCQTQAHQIASRNAIKHAPDLSFGIRVQISGCGSTPGTTIEIEAKPVPLNAAGTALERFYATATERRFMHVGTIGEIPDLVLRSTKQASTPATVVAAREEPRLRDKPG